MAVRAKRVQATFGFFKCRNDPSNNVCRPATERALFGCSGPLRIHEAQQLTVKQIISDTRIDQLFLKGSPKAWLSALTEFSALLRAVTAAGACFRASVVTLLNPELRRTVTYVALVNDNHLIDRVHTATV